MIKKLSSILAVAVAFGATSAFATTIPLTAVTTASYGTAVTGASVSGTTTAPTPPGQTPFTVTYSEQVYRGGSGALCATCLNFVFNFSNTAAAGSNPIERFSVSSLLGTTFTAGYVASAAGVSPGTSANESLVGTLLFGYDGSAGSGNAVLPGETADTLVVFTNSTTLAAGVLTFGDGTTMNAAGIVPGVAAAVTPEPSSLVLLGTGILGVAGAARRKFLS